MNDAPLISELACLPTAEVPEALGRRTRRRALARVGRRSPSAFWVVLAHAAIATACLAYFVTVVMRAAGLFG